MKRRDPKTRKRTVLHTLDTYKALERIGHHDLEMQRLLAEARRKGYGSEARVRVARDAAHFPCDFLVNLRGDHAVFIPTTERALKFTKRKIRPSPWQWVFGAMDDVRRKDMPGFTVAHAFAPSLMTKLQKDGFEVHER